MFGFKRRKPTQPTWACSVCGTSHAGLPTDFAWLLRDIAWNTDDERRQAMIDWSTELCYFESKWYVRGILEVPFNFESDIWAWGIWVEVAEQTLDRLKRAEFRGAQNEMVGTGLIANLIPLHPDSLGLEIEVKTISPDKRPSFILPSVSQHPLSVQRRNGIDEQEYHKLIAAIEKRTS